MPSDIVSHIARGLRESLAGTQLPPQIAKLYSHHTRLREGQAGLNWRSEDSKASLNDALRLIEVAFIEREDGKETWRGAIRRAGELLEWLSHPEMNLNGCPTRLLSAACYQLAGYPARASGLLSEKAGEDSESEILRMFLKAEFAALLENISRQFEREALTVDAEMFDGLHTRILRDILSALGILCAFLRWGDEPRLEKALAKLKAVGPVMLHSEDEHSWLLAKLCAEVAAGYVENSMRHQLEVLTTRLNEAGKKALERYQRLAYLTNRAILWPSQIRGIGRIVSDGSFALCTPTGSGKTTVAELAIIQSLFPEPGLDDETDEIQSASPLALYIVPTRALATEVEARLSRVLGTVSREQVITVTGLYGGTDWGPTDAWLTRSNPTVLICTFEKAEALLRFLGPLFINRVSLVVIDEAHAVQFDGRQNDLQSSESRPLRLEVLGMRLLNYLNETHSKAIMLSAVAYGGDEIIARWVAGSANAEPEKVQYRSTRQLIGRLECLPHRRFEIQYDLLDGSPLRVAERGSDVVPYIQNPFPQFPVVPPKTFDGPQKQLRPYLFWAAMHLAAPDDQGRQRAVLISISQSPSGYFDDLLNLLGKHWLDQQKPDFFREPDEPKKKSLWERCLRSCEDYFTKDSYEYQLLKHGIVVHHGRMPGLMGRLLLEVIQERIVHLVLATSTLSEGINLPFETILIPNLRRGNQFISAREFGNLVGRAGRPGYGTEGRTLVLMEPEPPKNRRDQASNNLRSYHSEYKKLLEKLAQGSGAVVSSPAEIKSPLAELIGLILSLWREINPLSDKDEFLRWLERTAPLEKNNGHDNELKAINTLDSLDGILLTSIVELEGLAGKELSPIELEQKLAGIWQRSFAKYASAREGELGKYFVRRGLALSTSIYPDKAFRRKLYRTSLPPESGKLLIQQTGDLRKVFEHGSDYSRWSKPERFEYIADVVDRLSRHPKFKLAEKIEKTSMNWRDVLRWWLIPDGVHIMPNKKQLSLWHKYVSQNFHYKFNWALGSVLSLEIDVVHGGLLAETRLEDWPKTGLPWVVLWLKELMLWGTLEPIAAYLLARGISTTRIEAEAKALQYYQLGESEEDANELLNASVIRSWAEVLVKPSIDQSPWQGPQVSRPVKLLRKFDQSSKRDLFVLPTRRGDEIVWIDPAGFPLATSGLEEDVLNGLGKVEYVLDIIDKNVTAHIYI